MSCPAVAKYRYLEKKSVSWLLFALLMTAFIMLSFSSASQESVTIDEFRHLSTGVHYWHSGDYSFDAATPPLWKMAMALPAWLAGAKQLQFRQLPEDAAGWEPWFVATDFMRDNAAAYTGYLQSARLVNLLAAAACLLLLYLRARKSFDPVAALFGVAFLAFSPTFLAHSHYATTDVIATLTLTALVFLLLDYLQTYGAMRLAAVALLLSLSLLCKFTALLLLPLLLLAPLLVAFKQTESVFDKKERLATILLLMGKSLLLISVIVLLTLNISYGFRGTGVPLREMNLTSRSLAGLAQSPVGGLPMLLPRGFVEGFDRQKADSDNAEFPAFFMGEWSRDGFRSYYLAAFAMKESIPFLLLLATALFFLGKRHWRTGKTELLFLSYLPVTLFIVLSCLNKLNLGVRYLLPAYPLLCFFIAGLFHDCRRWQAAKVVLPLLLVLHLFSVLRIAPHHVSYFNEFAGGPANGHRYLIDSNIDWGQDLPALKRYMIEQNIGKFQLAYFGHGLPELYGIDHEPLTATPKPGYVAISVSLLQGQPYLLTYLDPPQVAEAGQFSFMGNLQPVGRAGYSILIYKID